MVSTRRQVKVAYVKNSHKSRTKNARATLAEARKAKEEKKKSELLQKQGARRAMMVKKKEVVEEMEQDIIAQKESEAARSAHMKTIIGIWWSKKEAKKTAKAAAARVKKQSLKRSQSSQVDVLNPLIEELQRSLAMKDDKYKKLEDRLIRPNRNKLGQLPRKPLHEVKRSASLPRIRKIAGLILRAKRKTMSSEEFHQRSESVCHQLKIKTPEKIAHESAKLLPMEDIRLFVSMSGKQRRQLKSELVKVIKDIFAPNNQVCRHLKLISAELELGNSESNGKQFTWVSNVKYVPQRRLSRLHQSGNLDFSGNFEGNLFLFFVVDKGGTTTKCAIGVGNVKRANSADNLLHISLFDDSDDHQNLDKLKKRPLRSTSIQNDTC